MNNSNGIKRDKDNISKKYMENIIFPLTEILECIDELEIFTSNLSRIEFFENQDNVNCPYIIIFLANEYFVINEYRSCNY
ncbi:MAG: hypothetical protein ACTSQD_06290 [Promethearchaeota archaeon]